MEQEEELLDSPAQTCPVCGHLMTNITDAWHTYAEARGAEYLASYVTIWHCPDCGAMAGVGEGVEWLMETEGALTEE